MKLLFHCVHDTISLAMVEDLALAARARGWEVAFTWSGIIDFDGMHAALVRRGFPFKTFHQPPWKPDVQVVMDCRGYTPIKGVPTVDLGHGIGSKGIYYTPDTPYHADAVIFPSRLLASEHGGATATPPFLGLGMPKLDRVVRDRPSRSHVRNGKWNLLIAPTHNLEYTCLKMVKKALPQLAEHFNITIKPHAHYLGATKLAAWRKWLKTDARWHASVSWEANVADELTHADLVVSDVSSVFLECLGLGIPVVVCQNAAMRREARKFPDRPEYRFQDRAVVCTDAEMLPKLCRVALDRPWAPDPDLLTNPGAAIPAVLDYLLTLCPPPRVNHGPPDAQDPKPSSTSAGSSTSSTSAT